MEILALCSVSCAFFDVYQAMYTVSKSTSYPKYSSRLPGELCMDFFVLLQKHLHVLKPQIFVYIDFNKEKTDHKNVAFCKGKHRRFS